ncbi:MAG TPA: hypothetical protein VHZ33_33225 [Trebonia sp.]|jgi:hypothetical protein|nr:hypothetical protein [Trebonia sp.]
MPGPKEIVCVQDHLHADLRTGAVRCDGEQAGAFRVRDNRSGGSEFCQVTVVEGLVFPPLDRARDEGESVMPGAHEIELVAAAPLPPGIQVRVGDPVALQAAVLAAAGEVDCHDLLEIDEHLHGPADRGLRRLAAAERRGDRGEVHDADLVSANGAKHQPGSSRTIIRSRGNRSCQSAGVVAVTASIPGSGFAAERSV